MNFKIDENLPVEFVDLLTGAGHTAHTAIHENLAGADDSTIAEVCSKEDRVLVTLDFADIRSYPPYAFPGFIVMRPRKQDKLHLLELLRSVLPLLSIEPMQNRLWIVDEGGVRIRGEQT